MNFAWDPAKDAVNREKHGVSFTEAQRAFLETGRIIAIERQHGTGRETRFFCFGEVDGKGFDGAFHLQARGDPHIRRRVLARRKEAI